MDDQNHIFQLLFNETADHQLAEYKNSNLIDDLLAPPDTNSNTTEVLYKYKI